MTMLGLTAVFAFLWDYSSKGKKVYFREKKLDLGTPYLWMALTFLPMYLVNALMSYVGGDYGNYFRYFQRIVSGQEQEVEIGYKIICLLVSKLNLGFQWVYIFICLISYSLLIICIKKYSKNYAISYLMFFFNGYFALLGLNQIRQFVSVVVILYAMEFIQKQKILFYIAAVLIATCFHVSAIIMLPFYWILGKKWKLSAFITGCLVLLPFNFIFNEIMVWFFATFMPRYLNTNYTNREFSLDVIYLSLILVTFIVVLIFTNYNKIKNNVNLIFYNAIFVAVMLALFGSWLPEYRRFVYYFFMPSIVLVPTIMENKPKKYKCFVYIILFFVYIFYYKNASGGWAIYPYKSIWG